MVFWSLLILFCCLIVLTGWIMRHVQGVGILVTGNGQIALILYFLLIFPGILLHEVSHALAAWILRVPVRRFSIGIRPKPDGRQVALGSVEHDDTDPVSASLIGLAPFVSGCLAILLISKLVLGLDPEMPFSIEELWRELRQMYAAPDFWLWIYLVFAIGNAMFPSAADRRAWWIALLILAFAAAVIYFSGLFDAISKPLVDGATAGATYLTYAFAVAVAVDLVFVAVLFLLEQGLGLLGFGYLEYG